MSKAKAPSKVQQANPTFQFPPFYNLPPFFTLQPVENTRQKQTALWTELILNYCEYFKIFSLNLDKVESIDLFVNKTISSTLSIKKS